MSDNSFSVWNLSRSIKRVLDNNTNLSGDKLNCIADFLVQLKNQSTDGDLMQQLSILVDYIAEIVKLNGEKPSCPFFNGDFCTASLVEQYYCSPNCSYRDDVWKNKRFSHCYKVLMELEARGDDLNNIDSFTLEACKSYLNRFLGGL